MVDSGNKRYFLPLTAYAALTVAPCWLPGIVHPGVAFSLGSAFAILSLLSNARLHRKSPVSPFQMLLLVLTVFSIELAVITSPLPDLSFQATGTFLWNLGVVVLISSWWSSTDEEDRAGVLAKSLMAASVAASLVVFIMMERLPKFPLIGSLAISLPVLPVAPGIFPKGLPSNELGGVVAVFVPVLLGMLLGLKKGRTKTRYISYIVITLGITLFALLLTQSRTAWLGAAFGSIVVCLFYGKRGWAIIAGGLVFALAGLYFIGVDKVVDIASYNRRFDSILPLLTGRSEVWGHAWMLISDLPLIGIGPGTFGTVLPAIYPLDIHQSAEILEDAHNIFLQTWLDFGIIGLATLLLFMAFMLWRLQRLFRLPTVDAPTNRLPAGLLGGVCAMHIFNIFDAVSLTSPAAALHFLVLAALFGLSNKPEPTAKKHFPRLAVLFVLVALIIPLFFRPVDEQFRISGLIEATTAGHENNGVSNLRTQSPQLLWYVSVYELSRKPDYDPTALWSRLAKFAPSYISHMELREYDNPILAAAIKSAAPESPAALFWYGRTNGAFQPDSAISALRTGLLSDSTSGWAWLNLGNILLRSGDTLNAHYAFKKACFNDDPGLNGCWRAGITAELLGDTVSALYFYDLSSFPQAAKQAQILRKSRR